MICIITLKIKNSEKSDIIYNSSSLGNSVYMLEELAYSFLEKLRGGNNEIMKKLPKERGFYAVSTMNKITIYEKFKDGWFLSGGSEKVYEFELIISRTLHGALNLFTENIKTGLQSNEKIMFDDCLIELKQKIPIYLEEDTLN